MKVLKFLSHFTLIFIVILSLNLYADVGWLTNSRVVGGAVYSKVEHSEISLEKEVLIYKEEGDYEVYFLFKNNSEKPATVDVGFPVKMIIPLNKFDLSDPSLIILENVYGKDLFYGLNWLDRDNPPKLNKEVLNRKLRRIISWKKFKGLNKFWGTAKFINIAITQNGQRVAIDSVFMESQLIEDDLVVIQFHFLHKLSFLSNSFLNVHVSYSLFNLVAKSGSPYFTRCFIWRYILGTGRTWKGSIGVIYVLIPDHLKPNLPRVFDRVYDFRKNAIFVVENYEPLEEDEISIRYLRFVQSPYYSPKVNVHTLGQFYGKSNFKSIERLKPPAQSFVVVKDVSSYLYQKTRIFSFINSKISLTDPLLNTVFPAKYYKWLYNDPVFQDSFFVMEWLPIIYNNLDFSPISLFDGIPESAWCEGVTGNGVGEWVEFELKEDVWGLAIHNGFKAARWCFCLKELDNNKTTFDKDRLSKLKAIYSNNNRVKLIELISKNGVIKHKIRLKDTPEEQRFEDVYLPKGIYKLYIRDIIKGTKHEDACLGEIEFYPASVKKIIEADKFLKSVLNKE